MLKILMNKAMKENLKSDLETSKTKESFGDIEIITSCAIFCISGPYSPRSFSANSEKFSWPN